MLVSPRGGKKIFSMAGKRKVILIVTAVIFAATLLFFYKLLLPGRLVYQGDLTSSDVTELNFPRRDLLHKSLSKGSLPVWTNLIGCGFPLLGEGQTGIFYPPNLILFGLFNSVVAYNLSVILSFVLGMAFTYLLARKFERSVGASIFAAIAFGLSGFFITRIRFLALINGCSWLPLAHFYVESLYRERKAKYACFAGFVLAMQIFAGFVQIFYITALSVICHFIWRFAPYIKSVREKKKELGILRHLKKKTSKDEQVKGQITPQCENKNEKRNDSRRTLAFGLIAIILVFIFAAGIAAIQIMPTMEGMKVSNRAGGLKFSEATEFPLKPSHLLMFLLPYKFGNPALGTYNFWKNSIFWENCAFSGIITIILAIIAIVLLIRSSEVRFWTVLLLLSILLSLGKATPLYRICWKIVPGMNLFRFPQRFMLVGVLCLAMLSSAGIDFLTKKLGSHSLICAVSILILLCELFIFSTTQVNTIDSAALLEKPASVKFLESNPGIYRLGHIGELESWKMSAYDVAKGWHKNLEPYLRYRTMLAPEFNMVFGVEAVGSQGQYGIDRIKTLIAWIQGARFYSDYVALVPESSIKILGVQNVRYVFSEFRIQNRYLEPIASISFGKKTREIIIYRNLLEQPRAFVRGNYKLIRHPENIFLDTLFGKNFDPAKEVIIEEKPPKGFKTGGEGTARIKYYGSREVKIDVKTAGGGILVLSDSYYPGWKAKLDGKPVKILRANFAFRGVFVPDGKHEVEFHYSPGNIKSGAFISLLFLAVLLVLAIKDRIVSSRKKEFQKGNQNSAEE